MITTEKDKIVALCEKWGLKELNFTKGVYIAEDNSGITVNLRGDNPIVGVTITGQLHTVGHGNLKVEDYQREVDAIMKAKTSRSSSTEHSEKQPPQKPQIATEIDKSKPGTPDSTLPPAKLQKAKCKECNVEFELTLDEAHRIFEQYDGIYCVNCRTKEVRHEKKKAENEKKEGDNKAMETKIKTCTSCGLELSAARALECFQKDKSFLCEVCEDKMEGIIMSEKESNESNNLPALKKKQELVVGTCEAVATQYGIPIELANLFFMKMNEGLYIKNPGLLYLAGKKGYSRIEVVTTYDDKAQEWSAECKIYPKLTRDILEGISKLDKDLQRIAFDFATAPTNGTGRAAKTSVRMPTMHPFLKEMAQTRAQNRALRAFTGYGGTSYEEIPDGSIKEE